MLDDAPSGVYAARLDADGRHEEIPFYVRRHRDASSGESRFLDPTRVPADLPEGAAYAGIPVRYRAWMPDGRVKEMFKGGTPGAIEAFLDEHRAAGREVYGNPHRGYGGAYWPA